MAAHLSATVPLPTGGVGSCSWLCLKTAYGDKGKASFRRTADPAMGTRPKPGVMTGAPMVRTLGKLERLRLRDPRLNLGCGQSFPNKKNGLNSRRSIMYLLVACGECTCFLHSMCGPRTD